MTAGTPIAPIAPTAVGRPERPSGAGKWMATAVLAAILVWALVSTDANWGRLTDAPGRLVTNFRLMFTRMSWSDVGRSMEAMWESVAMAWLGTMLAAVFAIPLAFAAAENLVPRWMSFGVRQVFNLLRAIPEVILVLAIIPFLGLTPSAGVVTLGIGSIGTVSKLCSEVIEGIDSGPIEAADSVGANSLQRLRWAVAPQALPEIASLVLYRFEINIRVSAVLGALGVGGIGTVLRSNIEFKNWGPAGVALIVVVLATITVDVISGAVRRRLVAGPTGTPATREAHVVEAF